MANNFVMGCDALADNMLVAAGVLSGHPVQIGDINGVALADRDAVTLDAVVDFSKTKTWLQPVRNVLTYAAGVEDTFKAAVVGDKVYYDGSALVAGVFLSFSPLDKVGGTNKQWGVVTGKANAAVVATTMSLEVMPV